MSSVPRIVPVEHPKRQSPVTRVELSARVVGFYARDPGDGRWLWTVRWPISARRKWATRRYRHGKAATEQEALDAIGHAFAQGRPELEPIR